MARDGAREFLCRDEAGCTHTILLQSGRALDIRLAAAIGLNAPELNRRKTLKPPSATGKPPFRL